MKTVLYSPDATRALKRHGNMAARIMQALEDYAANPRAHANNVTQLVGSTAKRMRVGDYRAVFEETDARLMVTKIGPRGDFYA